METSQGKEFLSFLVDNVKEIRTILEDTRDEVYKINTTLTVTTEKVTALADYQKEMNGKVGKNSNRIAALELWKEKQAGISVGRMSVVALIASLAGFFGWTAIQAWMLGT